MDFPLSKKSAGNSSSIMGTNISPLKYNNRKTWCTLLVTITAIVWWEGPHDNAYKINKSPNSAST
jgi:hypothetical protein